MDQRVEIPKKLIPLLFKEARYRIGWGGRGSAKSWSYARALIAKSSAKPLRILCTREIQNSIKQSVHTLLKDQIGLLGLEDKFTVLETEISCINGSVINFAGLSNMTATSIKSYEGYDIVWVEEAQTVTKKSWQILIPTIRKEGSEIWVSFNPELDTDETYVRFVENTPPNSIVVKVNYTDNPYFSDVLEQERIHCKETEDEEDYNNIWEGMCRSAVQGAIYAKEVAAAVSDGRIARVPYDPTLKVHTIWDLGWNDSMVIILVQKIRSELRIIGYIEDDHKTLDWYAAELNKMNYNWGKDWLPHDGANEDYKTGKNTKFLLNKFGRKKVEISPKTSIESGIKLARMMFSQCVFDKVRAERLIECLKRYKRRINATTEEAGAPMHDEFSHGADAFRGLAVVAEMLTNEDDEDEIPYDDNDDWGTTVPGMGY